MRSLQMSVGADPRLIAIVVISVFFLWAVAKRMRPQPVRPNQLLARTLLVIVALTFSLFAKGGRIMADPVALALTPLFLLVGIALGLALVRTISFSTDPASGQLWMRGGFLFAAVLIVTVAIRLGFALLVAEPATAAAAAGVRPHGLAYDLSADLILLSLSLWVTRTALILLRAIRPDLYRRLPWLGAAASAPAN